MTVPPWRVGVDRIERTVVVENHDAAYGVWRDAGVHARTLLHVDAHHDMWRASGPDGITIANFISLALADDLIREVVWIVPDGTWESARGRRPILRHLRGLMKDYAGPDRRARVEQSRIWTSLAGKRLTVCPLRFLPRCDEAVLLDIDLDFMIIPRVSHRRLDEHAEMPWCWPGELIDRLRASEVKTDLVTVARSVEGGYTPLKWRYLGDELVQRLADPEGKEAAIRGMEWMREATVAAARGDLAAAERGLQAAAAALPESAAPHLHLAHLAIETGRLHEAQQLYRRARTIDATYATPFSTNGFPLQWDGRYKEAEHEFRRALLLDPADPHAHLGLGLIAAETRRWRDAEALLRAALARDDRLVEGHRALGRVVAHAGRLTEAIAAYERSLQLTLAGERPLARPIVTERGQDRLVDPEHCRVHADLADLYASRGSIARAIVGYQISLAGGRDEARLRRRLAWLYLQERDWLKAFGQLWRLLAATPRDCRRAVRRAPQRLWRVLEGKWRLRLAGPEDPALRATISQS